VVCLLSRQIPHECMRADEIDSRISTDEEAHALWSVPREAVLSYEVPRPIHSHPRPVLPCLTSASFCQGLVATLHKVGALKDTRQFSVLLPDGSKVHRDHYGLRAANCPALVICLAAGEALQLADPNPLSAPLTARSSSSLLSVGPLARSGVQDVNEPLLDVGTSSSLPIDEPNPPTGADPQAEATQLLGRRSKPIASKGAHGSLGWRNVAHPYYSRGGEIRPPSVPRAGTKEEFWRRGTRASLSPVGSGSSAGREILATGEHPPVVEPLGDGGELWRQENRHLLPQVLENTGLGEYWRKEFRNPPPILLAEPTSPGPKGSSGGPSGEGFLPGPVGLRGYKDKGTTTVLVRCVYHRSRTGEILHDSHVLLQANLGMKEVHDKLVEFYRGHEDYGGRKGISLAMIYGPCAKLLFPNKRLDGFTVGQLENRSENTLACYPVASEGHRARSLAAAPHAGSRAGSQEGTGSELELGRQYPKDARQEFHERTEDIRARMKKLLETR